MVCKSIISAQGNQMAWKEQLSGADDCGGSHGGFICEKAVSRSAPGK